MTLTLEQENAAKALNWDVIALYDQTTHKVLGYEFNNYSPAGEDISFEIFVNTTNFDGNFAHALQDVADDFDVDEHVELWLDSRGENGVPGSIRGLLEDAEAIQQMLYDLVSAVILVTD